MVLVLEEITRLWEVCDEVFTFSSGADGICKWC